MTLQYFIKELEQKASPFVRHGEVLTWSSEREMVNTVVILSEGSFVMSFQLTKKCDLIFHINADCSFLILKHVIKAAEEIINEYEEK